MSDTIEQLQGQIAAAGNFRARRLPLLNKLAFAYSRTDPQQGLKVAAEAEAIAVKLEDDHARAESLRVASWCHETLSEYPVALEKAEGARRIFRKLGQKFGEASCLNLLGVIAHGMTRFTDALESLRQAQALFEECHHQAGLASVLNNLGMVYQDLGLYPRSLDCYLAALRINEQLGDEIRAGANIGNIANVYYYLGDFQRSFQYDNRSLEIARRHNNLYGQAHTLLSIASNYRERGEPDAAIQALNQALPIFRQLQEKRYEADALIKLGRLYEQTGGTKKALHNYKQAGAIATEIGRQDSVVNALLHTGMLHASCGYFKRAIPVLLKGLTRARELEMPQLESNLLLQLSASLNAVGEYAQAYQILNQYTACHQKLQGLEQGRVIAEMQARFDVEKSEREQELLRLRNQHLQEVVDLRSKELTAMAMRLVQKNAFLQSLRRDMQGLAAENPGSKKMLDTLLQSVYQNIQGDDDWERFEHEFQLIHHDFLSRLSQQYPRLTPAELKVCAMLKINLSNKEIANLLSVSLRSIESHRYSIRKKLGLTLDANLTASLIGL